jgi:hypothetical protein
MGAIDSTLYEFQRLRYICGKKLGPHALSVLQSFHNGLNVREESVELVDYLGVALEMVDIEIAKFPPSQQDRLFLEVGPQLRSSFVILREELEKQKTEIQNVKMENQNMKMEYQKIETEFAKFRDQKRDISLEDVCFSILVYLLLRK